MKTPKIRLRHQRIGVIGLYRSGKTVFLTSLINHLKHHCASRFVIGRKEQVVFAEELTPSGFEPFPYSAHRNRLVAGEDWPEKTRGVYEYICRYYRSGWHFTRAELSLLDFPGERMADLTMANASFEQWSDLMLAVFSEHAEYREPAADYLALMASGTVTESGLLAGYRRFLAKCFAEYRPIICPSSFLISADGHWHGEALKQGGHALDECICGLDIESQFVPLSLELRRRNPDLSRRFARHYQNYRRKIVLPLAKWMRNCDALVALIDLTALLAGGEGMYQGNRELLRNLMDLLRPGQGYFGLSMDTLQRIFDPLGGFKRVTRHKWWPDLFPRGNISRIAFVGAKADKVHEADRDRLLNLTRTMTRSVIAKHEVQALRLDIGYFICAAVKSTRSMQDHRLQAHFQAGQKPQIYTPSHVPDEWPQTWPAGRFRFPNFKPWMPPLRDAPPDHIELDRIADFLLR